MGQTANEVRDEDPYPDEGDTVREGLYRTSVEGLKTQESLESKNVLMTQQHNTSHEEEGMFE